MGDSSPDPEDASLPSEGSSEVDHSRSELPISCAVCGQCYADEEDADEDHDEETEDVCCKCGQLFKEDDAFCMSCGAPRTVKLSGGSSCEELQTLEEMVTSGECQDGIVKKIWESVVVEKMKLQGNWEESAVGAFCAARRGDWAVCTYLAARCFMKHGAESHPDDEAKAAKAGANALAVIIDKGLDDIWVRAAPIVLNIPRGFERLWLRVEGSEASVWTEKGVKSFYDFFLDEGLRRSELPQLDHAVTERQRYFMKRAGEWNIEKLVADQHILQAEWVSSDRAVPVRKTNLRVLTNVGWVAASYANGVQGSAEHFSVGRILELSQLKWSGPRVSCLVLSVEEQRKLRDFVSGFESDARDYPFLGEEARLLGHVPGGCFQVLAYPLGGDFTKALLRPVERAWSDQHRAAAAEMMWTVGAHLITICAKAGKWSLVDILLSAGVEFPKIEDEFSDACGSNAIVRRHWIRDLAKVSAGIGRSLFEILFDYPKEMRSILEELQQRQLLPDLNRCCAGQTSLILAAGKAGLWNIVKMLLELGNAELNGAISVASLLSSPVLPMAPRACQELVHLHSAFALRAQNLQEYFERMVGGENMNHDVLPLPWTPAENGLLKREETVVFGKCTWLGGNSPERWLVFVRLSQYGDAADRESCNTNDELVEAADSLMSGDGGSFRISMSQARASQCDCGNIYCEDSEYCRKCGNKRSQDGKSLPRRAFLEEPTAAGLWLALVCTGSCLRKDSAGRLFLHVPMNSVPYPIILRVNIRIVVKSPCCKKEVKGVLIHIDGKPAGITNDRGHLELELPPGQHKLSAPFQASDQKVIKVTKGPVSEVELFISGGFYLFLQDIFGKTHVKVTTNRYKVLKVGNILPFVGEARLCGEIYETGERTRCNRTTKGLAFAEVLRIEHGTTCGQQLPLHVKPDPSCGTDYKPSSSPDNWFREYRDNDCAVAILFGEQEPMTLGHLKPADIPSPFAASPPLDLPVNVADDRASHAGSFKCRRGSRRCGGPRSCGRATCSSVSTRRTTPRRGQSAGPVRPKTLKREESASFRCREVGVGY